MNLRLKTLITTAYTEWKIQVRQRTTWLLAGMFFLVGWYSVDHDSYPLLSGIGIAIGTAQGIGLFGSIFVVTLSVTSFLREIQPTYDFLWTRAFHTNGYVVGKYLGLCAGVGTALLPVCLWVAYLEFMLHGFQGILIQAREWLFILVPSLTIALAVTFLLGLILKRTLWTILLTVLVVAGILALNLDVTHLLGFVPYGIYASPLIGYGPDTRLVTFHRAFYLELSILILALSLLAVRFTTPRLEKKMKRQHIVTWSLLSIGMLAVIFYTGINFQRESDTISGNPVLESHWKDSQDCSIISSYRVEFALSHETGRVDGKAYIGLSPSSASIKLPLDLNEGLQVAKISISRQDVNVEVGGDTLVLVLPRELNSQDIFLTLEYFGTLRIPRYLYDYIHRPGELAVDPFWPGGYIDRETAFLTRDGNWHPFPDCPLDALTVELNGAPSHSQMIHTADKATSSFGQTVLIWERQPPLPLIAASLNYRTTQVGEAKELTPPRLLPQNELDWVSAPYPVVMEQIDIHLQQRKNSTSQPFQIAILPLIKYGSYDPLTGTLLLPERDPLLVAYENVPYPGTSGINSPDLLYKRWVAERMMRLWWCNDNICPALQVDGYGISYMELPGSIEQGKTTLDALLTYTALRLAELLVGKEFVAEEMDARRRMLGDEIILTAEWLPLAVYSPEINRMVVQLDKIWEEAGAESFWRLVLEYHRLYDTTSLSEEEFEKFVKQITGVNLP